MAVGKGGKWRLGVSLYLLEHARRALPISGRVASVCRRPWAGDDAGTNIATRMTYFNVLLAATSPLQEYWRKLDTNGETTSALAGLY